MSLYHWMASGWTDADGIAVQHGEDALTWGQLRDRVSRAAGWLGARGLGPGDVLALQLSRSIELLELHLAALASGIVTVPMNDAYTADEARYLLADSGAKLAVLVDAIADGIGGAVVAQSAVRAALDGSDGQPLDRRVPAEAIAAICYTSGTTGRPKGALLTHANLMATVGALHEAWRWQREDVLVHALPLFHIHGLFVAQHGALRAGARSLWLPRFDAHTAMKALEERGGTVFMGVPTYYQRFLDLPADARYDLSRVRLFTCGSAGLPAHVHAAFERRFGHRILERYGMTEVGIVVSNPYDGERRPGAIGQPLPGVEARVIVPETGAEAGPEEVGELRLRGPSVFQGYLGQPEKTAEAFADGWMKTGDLARTDADGYLHLVGRSRDLVISGGLNVYPAEVEAVLAGHPDVAESAVVGVTDADLGERVVATVVPVPGRTPTELDDFARAHLAPYKCPKAWRFAETLPRNAMGKVQKDRVRAAWSVPVIRDGGPADAARLARYNVAMALETEDLALEPDVALLGARRVFEDDVGARYYVAEIAGAFAGQCMITTEWSDWRARTVWWLQSVYVLPAFRRHGVFRALYEHVNERAAAAGAAGLRLYVDRRNERAAAVYRKLGMNGDHYLVFERMFED